jgi:hypothetical protein
VIIPLLPRDDPATVLAIARARGQIRRGRRWLLVAHIGFVVVVVWLVYLVRAHPDGGWPLLAGGCAWAFLVGSAVARSRCAIEDAAHMIAVLEAGRPLPRRPHRPLDLEGWRD